MEEKGAVNHRPPGEMSAEKSKEQRPANSILGASLSQSRNDNQSKQKALSNQVLEGSKKIGNFLAVEESKVN